MKDEIMLGLSLLAAAVCFASDPVALPGEPCTHAPVPCAPFPDRMSAYVWRNWFCVPKERLASVVGATAEDIEAVAREMGLPPQPPILPEWRRKGYITVVRRNWHLLDYDQLLETIDMDREEFRFRLKEDDFLWSKLGKVKPKCGALRWSAGMREEGRGKREEAGDCRAAARIRSRRLLRGTPLHLHQGHFRSLPQSPIPNP